MKIYKISQNAQNAPTPEVQAAQQTIQLCILELNKSLKVIEKNPAIPNLFQKSTLINEIKSGNIRAFNVAQVQEVLKAMGAILPKILQLNDAVKTLENNKVDVSKMYVLIESKLLEGKIEESDQQNVFTTALPSNTNLSMPSNLLQ